MTLHNFIRWNGTSDTNFEAFNANFEFADEEVDKVDIRSVIWGKSDAKGVRKIE